MAQQLPSQDCSSSLDSLGEGNDKSFFRKVWDGFVPLLKWIFCCGCCKSREEKKAEPLEWDQVESQLEDIMSKIPPARKNDPMRIEIKFDGAAVIDDIAINNESMPVKVNPLIPEVKALFDEKQPKQVSLRALIQGSSGKGYILKFDLAPKSLYSTNYASDKCDWPLT